VRYSRNLLLSGAALWILSAALPAAADTQFRVRRMTRNDVHLGKGQCDIRLQVDRQVEVTVRGDMVSIHVVAGEGARDDGSECSAPVPDHELRGFRFEVKGKRGEIRLLSEPSRNNDYAAVVAIQDSSSGFGRYRFRLSWDRSAADEHFDAQKHGDPGHQGAGGFSWNNAARYTSRGGGDWSVNSAPPRRILDATVDIDNGGKVIVSFRARKERPLVFSGAVIASEGGRLKVDAASEDGRLHGPMYITLSGLRDVASITLEATDGRDHLRLNWNRR
jgi:hypothetical protein